jgi:hypothetical protein
MPASGSQESTYPPYRNENSYFVNGERQTILFDENFGAIVYMPEYAENLKLTREIGSTTLIETAESTVK